VALHVGRGVEDPALVQQASAKGNSAKQFGEFPDLGAAVEADEADDSDRTARDQPVPSRHALTKKSVSGCESESAHINSSAC
jgi:hypothetical protein